jgi:hypothetical protein
MVTLRSFLSVYDHKVSVSALIMRRSREMEFSALDGLRLAQDEVEVGHDAGRWLAEQLSAAPHPKCSCRATFLDFWEQLWSALATTIAVLDNDAFRWYWPYA